MVLSRPNHQINNRLILSVYLTYLYAGFTQEQIVTTFQIQQTTVSDYIKTGRKSLSQFVAKNLGIRGYTRLKLFENQTQNVKTLSGLEGIDNAVTIWDATYEYLPKIANFRFQAATFSSNKKRNPVKHMVALTPNGMIVEVFGPTTMCKSTMHDRDILNEIMKLNEFQGMIPPWRCIRSRSWFPLISCQADCNIPMDITLKKDQNKRKIV